MRYCPNCGTEVEEGAAFCSRCGTAQQRQQSAQRSSGMRKRLHCPNCRSTNLTPIVESTSTIGSVGRISKNIALTGTNVNNKSFWMCQECGHKFRNLEDLIQENKRYFSQLITGWVVIGAVITILFVLLGCFTGEIGAVFVILIADAICYAFCKWFLKKEKQKRDTEERKLRRACFE